MEIEIKTEKWQDYIDITELVEQAINKLLTDEKKLICNKKSGACLVYCPHTTAGLTINEGYDKNVMFDVVDVIDELTPRLDFQHKEGNSPAHAKSSLVGVSLLIPLNQGKLELGKWQKIFFLEFDGPKERKFSVQLI